MERSNPIAKAYATVECAPGCTRRELKRQYKRLVRRWHPDQYSDDSIGQIEAAQRMREINRAYDLIQESLDRYHVPTRAAVSSRNTSDQDKRQGRRLSQAEIDAIAQAIGTVNPIYAVMKFLSWFGPMALAFVLVQDHGQVLSSEWSPPTLYERLLAFVSFFVGVCVLIRRTWLRKR
jgi:curved DNA-binding protein CbpA